MKLLNRGKTKDVYQGENSLILKFKDTATGKDGVFDPGANHVGLEMEGAALAGLKLSKYFFEKIEEKGYLTHYIDTDLDNLTMAVKKAETFGNGLEMICRYRAVGSFIRRYGAYIEEGTKLPGYIEITIKDDEREDPLITKEGLEVLNLLNEEEYEKVIEMTRGISNLIKDELEKRDLELYDIKIEFGRIDGEIALIDELSGGNMRVYSKDGIVDPIKLADLIG